jgi:hypothetical protein
VIPVSGGVRVCVAMRPIDFRKGHDGLAAVVQEVLKLDPFCGAIFVFRSKRADRLKLLVWDDEPCRAIGPSDNGEWAGPGAQAARERQVRLAEDRGRGDEADAGAILGAVRGVSGISRLAILTNPWSRRSGFWIGGIRCTAERSAFFASRPIEEVISRRPTRWNTVMEQLCSFRWL